MEVEALFGRFVWRGVNIDDVTIHPSRGSRINPTLKQDSTTGNFPLHLFISLQDIFWDRQSDRKFRKWLVFNQKYAEIGDRLKCW